MDQKFFQERRQQLLAALPADSIALLPTATIKRRSADSEYSYRPDSDFYYLTGFAEPEAVAVLCASSPQASQYILFNRVRDREQEIWTGKRAGQEGACNIYQAQQAFAIEQFTELLPKLLAGKTKIYYPLGRYPNFDKKIRQALLFLQHNNRAGEKVPCELIDIAEILHEMRLIKQPAELALMRQAAKITTGAHQRAMQVCRPGMMEYQLEAELLYEFYRHGSRYPAYNSIVASGSNACVLHYNDNNAEIKNDDLVLIDAGCEYGYYASDVTRTFPANGHFSKEQQAIYEIVLQAQLDCIAAIRPGVARDQLQTITATIITQGLVDLKILSGNVSKLVAASAYRPFYMHYFGHWLGMDVHDVGKYKSDAGDWRKLQEHMVLTVEPGIYIAPGSEGVDEKWWNIGVRIEDDVAVSATGSEVLTDAAPKTVQDIQMLMQGK